MAAEVRNLILALLEEPQTEATLRKIEFLERDLIRLETPAQAPAAPGNYPVLYISCIYVSYLLYNLRIHTYFNYVKLLWLSSVIRLKSCHYCSV
jgi:hypothetical protein